MVAPHDSGKEGSIPSLSKAVIAGSIPAVSSRVIRRLLSKHGLVGKDDSDSRKASMDSECPWMCEYLGSAPIAQGYEHPRCI